MPSKGESPVVEVNVAILEPNQKGRHSMSLYLQTLKQNRITPNFWCSQEYFDKAGLEEDYLLGWVIITDPEYPDKFVLPPIYIGNDGKILKIRMHHVWADLHLSFSPYVKESFLDYEFIYDQRNFLNMSGQKWSVFRKNSRKWLRGKDTEKIAFVSLLRGPHYHDQIDNVFIDWLLAQGEDEEIQDSETMTKFLYEGHNRFGLFYGDELKAVLVYDYNWKYINFRYCVCKNEPWLSEYARLRFYLDSLIQQDPRLVNDGGCLGSDGLYFFKHKMNPVEIRKRHSWR